MTLNFIIYGHARPQGSKRSLGSGRMVEASPHVKTWRQDVASAALNAIQEHGSWDPFQNYNAWFVVVFPRPKTHYGTGKNSALLKHSAPSHPTSRLTGDVDKLARALLDGLTGQHLLWVDDSQVTSLSIAKRYANLNEPPCVFCTIKPATPTDASRQ